MAENANPPAGGDERAPFKSMNDLLKWGLTNSDDAELRAAAARSDIDPSIIDMILPDDGKNIEVLVAFLQSGEASDEETALTLEHLQFYMESIDNSANFKNVPGGWDTIDACIAAGATEAIRSTAAHCLATILQQNPTAQAAYAEAVGGSTSGKGEGEGEDEGEGEGEGDGEPTPNAPARHRIHTIIDRLAGDGAVGREANDKVRAKLVSVVSAFVRHNPLGLVVVRDAGGLDALLAELAVDGEGEQGNRQRIQVRVLHLMTGLLRNDVGEYGGEVGLALQATPVAALTVALLTALGPMADNLDLLEKALTLAGAMVDHPNTTLRARLADAGVASLLGGWVSDLGSDEDRSEAAYLAVAVLRGLEAGA